MCHTATHCNTRQHTATHCNTLDYSHVSHCNTLQPNTLQHTATRCNTLQRTTTHLTIHMCQILDYLHVSQFMHAHKINTKRFHKHAYTHYNTMHHTAPHCTTLHHTTSQCITLQHTAPHYTTLHHTAPHCTTLHIKFKLFGHIYRHEETHRACVSRKWDIVEIHPFPNKYCSLSSLYCSRTVYIHKIDTEKHTFRSCACRKTVKCARDTPISQ